MQLVQLTRLRGGLPKDQSSIPERVKYLSILHAVRTTSQTNAPFYKHGTGGSFRGLKVAGSQSRQMIK